METNEFPKLDFDAVAALPEEARAAAIADYGAAVEAYTAAAAEKTRAAEDVRQELAAAKYSAAKYKLAADGNLAGFDKRIPEIESILSELPVLDTLSDEDKLRTAYYIDRGRMPQKEESAEALLEKLKASPEAMRLCEAAILEKLRAAATPTPALFGTTGGESLPMTPKAKPRSIDEASRLAREAFGL